MSLYHMYCIHQKDKDSNEKVIGYLDCIDDFPIYVAKHVLPTMNISFTLFERLNPKTDVLEIYDDHIKYPEGNYLIEFQNKIELEQKTRVYQTGYLYNSYAYEYKTLFTWKLLPFEIDDKLTFNQITVPQFSFSGLSNTSSFLIHGPPASGKTHIIYSIINELNQSPDFINNLLIICPGKYRNQFYSHYFPGCQVSTIYDREVITNHIANGKGCIIFDDSLTKENVSSLPAEIYEHKIPFIVASQSIDCLQNITTDFCFILSSRDITVRKKIFKRFEKIFCFFSHFNKIYGECIKNYSSMVVDNRGESINATDNIYRFKSGLAPKMISGNDSIY